MGGTIALLLMLLQGAMLPPLVPLRNATGGTASGSMLCTFAAGTTTPKNVYVDKELTKPLPNPATLNSGGYPTSGQSVASIYLDDASYKFTVYSRGTGNTCNGRSVGSAIWTRDNIYEYGKSLEATWIAALPLALPLSSGTYTPTVSCYSNCATVTTDVLWLYTKIGNRVFVDGRLTMDPGIGGAVAKITLPIKSRCAVNALEVDIYGFAIAHLSAVADEPGGWMSCSSPDEMLLGISSPAGAARTYTVSLQYEVH